MTRGTSHGFALRLTPIRNPHRLKRLLILVLEYIVLVATGLPVAKFLELEYRCSDNRAEECSLFTIGRQTKYNPLDSLRAALTLLRQTLV